MTREMRHGHKSSFVGSDETHEGVLGIVVDTDTQLITSCGGCCPATLRTIVAGTGGGERGQHRRAGVRTAECFNAAYGLTAIPGRPSRDAGRTLIAKGAGASATGPTFRRRTSILTWRRAVAPVRRRTGYPHHRAGGQADFVARDGSTACGPTSSTGRYAGHVHCGPSASRLKAGKDGGC